VEQICFVMPLQKGMTDDARAFMREIQVRRPEYEASLGNGGITKETWFLTEIPTGDALVAYMESPDLDRGLTMFAESQDEFDLWFKRRLADSTGIDLNEPAPEGLFEILSSYEAPAIARS
jgi:hypothetical protein